MKHNSSPLIEPTFIKKLELLALLSKRMLGGELKADRKSTKRGSGTTFADYAEYNWGDDFRNIDWNIYARLEQMVIKLFELEEDLRVFVLLDISPSMHNKLLQAQKIAAAIGYIALNHLDHLTIYGVNDRLQTIMPPAHGRNQIFPMLQALDKVSCYGHASDLQTAVEAFLLRHRRPGVCVIISDFFIPSGYQRPLEQLQWNRHDIYCIQMRHPDEQHCQLRGDIELNCIETGTRKRVMIGPREAAQYRAAIEKLNDELRQYCAKRGIGLATAATTIAFEEIIRHILLRGGLVA